MSIINFKRKLPWSDLLTNDFLDTNDFFNDRFWLQKANEPALNIKEKDDAFEIELAAPGFDKKDFEVTIDNGYLNICAKKTVEKEEKDENYTRKEFSFDSFERSLKLPETVIDDNVKAKYKNGILKFSLAKKEEAKKLKPKVVEIA